MKSVVDGDTLKLQDGQSVRLIGVNAPEEAHGKQHAEPFARQATQALRLRLHGHARVALILDSHRIDGHGRLLAHVFTASDGENLQSWLLANGFAQRMVVPPNLKYLDCYRRSEALARKVRKGLWSLSAYESRPVSQLQVHERGFRYLRGQVGRIRTARRGTVIELGPHFSIFIDRRDLPYFHGVALQDWHGRELRIRGYVTVSRGQFNMRLRHPANVEVAPSTNPGPW